MNMYPQQFECWEPGRKVFWMIPEDTEVAREYNGRRKIRLKKDAVYIAASHANLAISRMITAK